jgi:hypothetical protein
VLPSIKRAKPEEADSMLGRLLRIERTRFSVILAALVFGTGLFVVLVVGPLVVSLNWGKPAGLVFFCAFSAGSVIVPWAVFGYRFCFLSSARGLRAGLARYGRPDEILQRIDEELRARSGLFMLGQTGVGAGSPQPDCLIMSANWLVRLCPGGSAVIHLPDLAWVHKRVVAKSALLSMVRMEEQLGCRASNGNAWNLETWTELKTDLVLRELLERRPELLTGYRGEWLELAESGEATVAAELQQPREKLAALTPELREQWLDASWDDAQRFVVRIDRQAAAR